MILILLFFYFLNVREDVAVRVIPAVSPLLVDVEKQVRTQASQCIKIFIKRIHKLCEDMENNPSGNATNTTEGSVLPNIANINIGTDAGVLGWAFNSLTKKVTLLFYYELVVNTLKALS